LGGFDEGGQSFDRGGQFALNFQPHVKKLVDANILNDRALDIKRLKPFTMTAKRMELARDRSGRNKWALGPLQQLEKMARAMGNLVSCLNSTSDIMS
jgi:ATP-dependent DNA helicase MPH1